VVNSVPLADANLSPTLHWALWMGWGALALAACAAAALLAGVIALSERRASFVSSVTHELRTPLTTFRMYAEMLARGMVPNEARRQEYLHTLEREADRLTHLVENVLSYARLERGRRPQIGDCVTPASLLARIGPRLEQRAAQVDSASPSPWRLTADKSRSPFLITGPASSRAQADCAPLPKAPKNRPRARRASAWGSPYVAGWLANLAAGCRSTPRTALERACP
jgi:signal transduction histidine kinase